MNKAPLRQFLARNPFPDPMTLGFFYREKMRSIHWVAPDLPFQDILEVGGGRSGLTAMLYLGARITNLDCKPEYVDAPCNRQKRVRYVVGDATALPYGDASFDAVTMFDLLEHVLAHEKAVREAMRVLRPGGFLLVSSPSDSWRFPYYRFMARHCPSEEEMFAEWGHVRRGYSLQELKGLIPLRLHKHATFINMLTVLCHDVGFSRLPYRWRRNLCVLLAPITGAGYLLHRSGVMAGTETATAWEK